MDASLYRWINRLADRTGWAHGLFKANAGYGIALFAILLLVSYIDGRQHDDLTAVAASVWAALAALVALGIGQIVGNAVDRARPYDTVANMHVLVDNQQADGSWDAEASYDRQYGNSYTTALVILSLTPPYQLLPIYQR